METNIKVPHEQQNGPFFLIFSSLGNGNEMGFIYFSGPQVPSYYTHDKIVGIDEHIAQQTIKK